MTSSSDEQIPNEIKNQNELMFRQIAPTIFEEQGRVSSQVFRPTNKDKGLLSTQTDRIVTPQEAHNRYVSQGLRSAGVCAVKILECHTEQLKAHEDPQELDDSHCVIDFRHLSNNGARKIGARLAEYANKR